MLLRIPEFLLQFSILSVAERDSMSELESIKVPFFQYIQFSFSNDTNEQSSISEQAMYKNAFQANHENGELVRKI
jgi:hypothetical protein